MRAALLAVLVGACVSSSVSDDVPTALRGCWIERRGEDTVTMRWFPAEGSSWRGDQLFYTQGQEPAHHYFLVSATAGEREQFGWAICPHEDEGLSHGPPCQKLFFGDGHVENDVTDWMEIHASQDRMRLVLNYGGESRDLFNGARDGCD